MALRGAGRRSSEPPPQAPDGGQLLVVRIDGQVREIDPTQLEQYPRSTRRALERSGAASPRPTAAARAAGAADLALQGANAAVAALTADRGAHHAYQVVFEENLDGRRRAMYHRVDVAPDDPVRLHPSLVYVDDAGDRRSVATRYRSAPAIRPTDPGYVVVQPR